MFFTVSVCIGTYQRAPHLIGQIQNVYVCVYTQPHVLKLFLYEIFAQGFFSLDFVVFFKLTYSLINLPYAQYFLRVLYFVDNLSGRIFAFKFSLMAYLNTNCSISYSLLMEIFKDVCGCKPNSEIHKNYVPRKLPRIRYLFAIRSCFVLISCLCNILFQSTGLTMGSSGGLQLGSSGGFKLGSSGGLQLGSSGGFKLGITKSEPATVSEPISGGLKLESSGGLQLGSGGGLKLESSGGFKLGLSGDLKLGSGGNLKVGSSSDTKLGTSSNLTFSSGSGLQLGSNSALQMGSTNSNNPLPPSNIIITTTITSGFSSSSSTVSDYIMNWWDT